MTILETILFFTIIVLLAAVSAIHIYVLVMTRSDERQQKSSNGKSIAAE